MVGQQLFRHKTQKQPFKRWFIASVIVNILVVGAVYALLPLSHH
jgi:uncharacterized membrane protein YsdA (DUF1294 family)